jgi:hypothetical protein
MRVSRLGRANYLAPRKLSPIILWRRQCNTDGQQLWNKPANGFPLVARKEQQLIHRPLNFYNTIRRVDTDAALSSFLTHLPLVLPLVFAQHLLHGAKVLRIVVSFVLILGAYILRLKGVAAN